MWCRVERFRAGASRRRCLTGDFWPRASCRSSLATALAAARKLLGPRVNALAAANLLGRAAVVGRTGVPPSTYSIPAVAVAVRAAAQATKSAIRLRPRPSDLAPAWLLKPRLRVGRAWR